MRKPGELPGALERMPKWLICVPLVVQWLWLALRYRSVTLPSAANPSITAGGLVGEGKLEYFRGMGPVARAATARHCSVAVGDADPAQDLQELMAEAGLSFPVVAKPDLGLCGFGVRRIDDMAALQTYVANFPVGEVVVLQEYLAQEGEAGIFYARDPATGRGTITGLALRHFPRVVGDGARTVGQFYVTDRLTAAIDAIARDMPDFHFGRFDVRFDNLRDLSAGVGFTIMEINGAGSEAIEAWDPDTGLLGRTGCPGARCGRGHVPRARSRAGASSRRLLHRHGVRPDAVVTAAFPRRRARALLRSCVHADWRRGGVIMAMWSALAHYMQRHELDTMIGCASVSLHDGGAAAAFC